MGKQNVTSKGLTITREEKTLDARIKTNAAKVKQLESELGPDLYRKQQLLAAPGRKGKFEPFLIEAGINPPSAYRWIDKYKIAKGLMSPKKSPSGETSGPRIGIPFTEKEFGRLKLTLGFGDLAIKPPTIAQALLKLAENSYAKQVKPKAISLAVPAPSVTTSTTAINKAA